MREGIHISEPVEEAQVDCAWETIVLVLFKIIIVFFVCVCECLCVRINDDYLIIRRHILLLYI